MLQNVRRGFGWGNREKKIRNMFPTTLLKYVVFVGWIVLCYVALHCVVLGCFTVLCCAIALCAYIRPRIYLAANIHYHHFNIHMPKRNSHH